MYDLLIKGGRVIDPAQNIDDKLDIAINGDKIAAVAKDIPPTESKKIIDASGKIVTPGLIDLHCHVFDSIHKISVEPDIAGVRQGVTTVGDGGSAGEATFAAFPKYVIPPAKTRVFCFIHLCSFGLIPEPELRDWDEVKLEAIAETIESHRSLIKGVKLRLVGNLVAREGIKVVEVLQKIAKKFGLPIMVHIGDMDRQVPPSLTQEFLPLMEPGDILSHIYTGNPGNPLRPDGTVLPEMRAAMERGVIMDTAIGRNNLNFEVAKKSLAQGILPTTLSTDLTHRSLTGPTYSLPVTMAKFMALGLDLKQVIQMTTINPARALKEDGRIGSLKPGMEADISILELSSGKWKLEDALRQTVEATQMLTPSLTIKAGEPISPQPVAQPEPMS
ncbi:MAG TPA: amidohydrolase/deacetylase family metallohydrolase [Dehalococcoidia bacterium]|nr:amidohydrolase/deacetylase family metallohydrolase [Dehalococcoidia bacterium]